MNKLHVGRWIGASLAVFAAQMAAGFLIHGWFLKGRGYYDNPLWRQEADMRPIHSACFFAALLIFSFAFVWVYHYGWKGAKWEGLRYGLFIAFLYTIPLNLLWYGLQPVGEVAAWWLALEVPATLLYGLVAGAIYKPQS